jgi:hypothetical protein
VDGAEPVFSTSHGAAFTTVDYIWYTPQVSKGLTGTRPHPAAAVTSCGKSGS